MMVVMSTLTVRRVMEEQSVHNCELEVMSWCQIPHSSLDRALRHKSRPSTQPKFKKQAERRVEQSSNNTISPKMGAADTNSSDTLYKTMVGPIFVELFNCWNMFREDTTLFPNRRLSHWWSNVNDPELHRGNL